MVLSAEPEASTLPSGDQAMRKISAECPRSVWRSVKPGGMLLCAGFCDWCVSVDCCLFVRLRGIQASSPSILFFLYTWARRCRMSVLFMFLCCCPGLVDAIIHQGGRVHRIFALSG